MSVPRQEVEQVAAPQRSLAALRARFRDGKAALVERFLAARPTASAATRLLRTLTRHVDATLADLWQHSEMPPGAALVAVGGYGRGELFPHSDVDVLVLLPDDPGSDALRASVSGFIAACWDIGLEIGSSVRSVDECNAITAADVTVQTALLEARCVFVARQPKLSATAVCRSKTRRSSRRFAMA